MFNTILSSGGIGNSLGTFDIVVIICVCSIVELFKQKVFHNNAKFKSLCPYITVILAFIIYLVFGLSTKSVAFWDILCKGLIALDICDALQIRDILNGRCAVAIFQPLLHDDLT